MEIGFFQTDLFWEDAEQNLASFEEKIAALAKFPDGLFLPEMFNTGFSMQVSEPQNFHTHKWLDLMAKRHKMFVAGSYAVKVGQSKRNRFLWAFADQEAQFYDKKHLFSHGNEQETFTAGTERKIISYGELSFLPHVCYDLRFPVWSRNVAPHYDVIVYVASWPERRIEHWKALLRARAIENQCYVIGVNRLGKDGNGLNYTGQSCIIKYDGELMLDAGEEDGYFCTHLSKADLDGYRGHYGFLADQDKFKLY